MRQPNSVSPSPSRSLCHPAVLALFAVLILVPGIQAADYYVATTGDDARSAAQAQSASTPWRTITHALSNAVSGDTINVAAGIYAAAVSPEPGETFPLQLVDGVAVVGAGPASTSLTPSGTPAFENGFEPLTAATQLSGFTITDASGEGSPTPLMVFFPGSSAMSPTIDGNVFDGNGAGVGIIIIGESLGGSFTGTISNNSFIAFGNGTGELGVESPFVNTAVSIVQFGVWTMLTGDALSPVIANNQFSNNSQAIAAGEFEGETTKSSAPVKAFNSAGAMAPVIRDNVFNEDGIDVWFQWFGVLIATFAPHVTGNESTSPVVGIFFLALPEDPAIAPAVEKTFGNASIISRRPDARKPSEFETTVDARIRLRAASRSAIDKDMHATASDNTFAPVISDNVVNNALLGSIIAFNSFFQTNSLAVDLAITDNVFSGGVGFLVALYSMGELTEVADTIRIERNISIGSVPVAEGFFPGNALLINGAVSGFNAKQHSLAAANDVRIAGNHLEGHAEYGLMVGSRDYSTQPFVIECNTIIGNGVVPWPADTAGFIQQNQPDPVADLGGGGWSTGSNNIYGNKDFELINRDPDLQFAESNYWGVTDAAAIDAVISDDNEGSGGAVDFEPFLSTAASCAVVVSSADIALVKTADAAVAAGGTITYTLTATNNGPDAATNVVIADTLPAGTTFVSASAGCAHAAGIVTCTAASLASGAQMVVTIAVTAPATPGDVTNSATIVSDLSDPVAANNASQAVTAVTAAPTDVPAMNDWTLALLALLLMGSAVVVISRRGV